MPDHTLMLVCLPVVPGLTPVKGSFVAPCSCCPTLVWVSPSAGQVLDRAAIVCPTCALDAAREAKRRGEPTRFGGLLPGQLDELRAAALDARDSEGHA